MGAPSSALAPRTVAAVLVLIGAASVATQGYEVGVTTQGIQIPIIRQYAGDTAFLGDHLIQGLVATYTTVFFPALGWLARLVPLLPLLFVSFLCLRALSLWLSYRLGRALFGDAKTGLWTAAILAVEWRTFARDFVSETFLSHGALAQVMTLGALVLLAEGRVVLAFLAAGLLFHVHGMHATHLLVAMGLALLSGPDRRARLGALVRGSIVALAAMSPTIYWMISSGVLGGVAPPGYVEQIRAWFPVHFWPTSWAAVDICSYLFMLLAAWPLARLAERSGVADGGRHARLAVAAFLFATLGGLATELHATPFLIRLHPLRASWLVALAGAPYLARAVVDLLQRGRESRLALASGLALAVGIAMPATYRDAYFVTMLPLLWAAALDSPRVAVLGLPALALAVPLAQLVFTARSIGLGQAGVEDAGRFVRVEGALTGLLVVLLLAELAAREAQVRRILVGAVAVLAALQLVLGSAGRVTKLVRGEVDPWREAQVWSRDHLAPGERVLVPLSEVGFRAFSSQTPAVDFQDGHLLFHDPSAMGELVGRMSVYGWRPAEVVGFGYRDRLEALDRALDHDGILRVGQALGAKVAVRRTTWPRLPLPVLFENASFVIQRLDPGADEGSGSKP